MGEKTLSNPTVEVNNQVIGIVPNSVKYKNGKGDKNLRPQSAGGNSIEMIATENAETKKGMVSFELYNTQTNDDLVASWQDAVDGVAIRLSDGSFVKPFRRMHVINDPEFALGADGMVPVLFEGDPVQ